VPAPADAVGRRIVDEPAADSLAGDVATVSRIDVVPTILEVVCRTTGLGFSAVARVTEDHWVACAVRDEIAFGLKPGGELGIETTICNEIRQCGQLVAIDEVATDETYRDHPTPAMYGFQSYISVPIWLPGGRFFGTLCGIDPKPHRVSAPETVGMFTLFAQLIGMHLHALDAQSRTEAALSDARTRSELQEQFIAVLGHDLRSPLSAVKTSARFLLAKTPELGADGRHAAEVIDRGASRMAGLIDDLMDFARGRLGGGLELRHSPCDRLDETIAHVVTEVRASRPTRVITCDVRIDGALACDAGRVAQLLTNLLTNALTHGDGTGPVRVVARGQGGGLELSVSNTGKPISEAARRHLFQPFSRSTDGAGREGLGLGLYIASEIARGHGGTLVVESTAAETRFTFRLPPTSAVSAGG
jgi:signal transduction histidine kinase